jgi:hypothetical protein
MLRSFFRAASVVALFASVGQAEQFAVPRVCAAAKAPGFAERIAYMAGGGEGCEEARCLNRPVVLGKWTYVEVVQDSRQPNFASLASPVVEAAATVVSDTVGINFHATFDDAESFLFFVVVSPETEDLILNGQIEGVNQQLFRTFVIPALRASSCSGIATHLGGETSRLMHRAITFIPEAIVSDEKALRKCIFEEMMNATGLLRDPPGSASLFDNGNFRLADGKLTYSDETLAMLKIHYGIARGAYRDVNDFLFSQCGVTPG